MSSQNTSEFCIANQDIPLVKDDGQSTWIKGKAIELLKDIGLASGSPDHLLKGDLIAIDGYTSKGSVHGTLVSDHSKRIECPKSNVTSVTDTEYRLLAPIKVASARWDLFNSTDAMQIVRRLKLDERVWVSIPVNEGSISVAGSGCLPGTIRYIGPIQDEIGTYFGIELQEPKGTCDGSFRESRYFMCKSDHGIFLPASHLINARRSQAPSKSSEKVLVPREKTKSEREFYENDKVYVFDKNGQRINGKAKWAYPERNVYVIGVEAEKPGVSRKIEGHISGMSHYFKTTNYKKYSYLALPETVVLKDEGTSIDSNPPAYSQWEDLGQSVDQQKMSQSIQVTASELAKRQSVSTSVVINEQCRVMEGIQNEKDRQKAEEFQVSADDLKAQTKELEKWERHQKEKDSSRQYQGIANQQEEHFSVPGTSTYENPNDNSTNSRRKLDDNIHQKPEDRANQEAFRRQQSEGHSPYLPCKSHPVYSFEIGSLVEVSSDKKTMSGTIRWIGNLPPHSELIAGVELDELYPDCGNGFWDGEEYFKCNNGHGMFVLLSKLRPDPRYPTHVERGKNPLEAELQGKKAEIEVDVPCPKAEEISKLIGDKRGIQGHQNSCYLDSTLFAMYGFTGVFDDLILEEPQDDVAEAIVKIMSREIINPLRMNGVIRFDPVMKLRHKLDKLNRMKGLTHAEQDPEEFLNLLFKHVLKVLHPFIELKRPSGKDTEFFLQLFVEKSEKTLFTMKEMLFQCMKEQRISFAEAPQRLIIQLPRYGKDFKVYERIYPELHLDVSDICADYVPPGSVCGICGGQPKCFCWECGTKDTVFQDNKLYLCNTCNKTVHRHPKRQKHNPESCDITTTSPRKVTLDLLSVVCIEKSHYVCFSRHGSRWFFFDSMADRTDDGFNIPCVQECPEIGEGLEDIEVLRKKPSSGLPPLLRRLVNDASICIYIDREVEMY